MVTVEFLKANSIFIRSGSCNRCGLCCICYDKHPQLGGVKIHCKDLVFDKTGLATCLRHEVKRPQVCVDNPIYPTACMVKDAVDTCGYSWVVNDKLTKEEALKMFHNLCNTCHLYPCEYYHEVIKEIEEKLK